MRLEGLCVNEKSTDTSWDRTSDLPICSTAPSPMCYRGILYIQIIFSHYDRTQKSSELALGFMQFACYNLPTPAVRHLIVSRVARFILLNNFEMIHSRFVLNSKHLL